MNLSQDEILQILRLLEDSKFDELDLQVGAFKLRVKRKEAVRGAPAGAEEVTSNETETTSREAQGTPVSESEMAKSWASPEMNEQEKGWSPIRAPILGIFYRRPSPEEPPFVDTGAFVSKEDTVCLLEVMKVFNTVKAGVTGYIEKICAESGELVEFGQILFWVRPDAGPWSQPNVS
jgi:acetyl-CoA carboxylase biotin carboxyl carrier protein